MGNVWICFATMYPLWMNITYFLHKEQLYLYECIQLTDTRCGQPYPPVWGDVI